MGFKKELVHLDGHTVLIERSEVTPPGYVMTIAEEGMPVHTSPSQLVRCTARDAMQVH